MSRRNARRPAPVLRAFTRLERREREWAHQHGDDLRHRAERAMQEFKRTLPARTLKTIGEYKSKKLEVRAHMKRTARPRAGAVRHVPVTPEKEQEALRMLASRSKSHPLVGIQTAAADGRMHTVGRDHTARAVRKQDVPVARTATPADEKPASQRAGSVLCDADAGAPKQAG
jgi:hypothetical protein